MLGTNGGGFFNANSAHPYREPDAAFQLPADSVHLHHSRRAHLHAGPHDRLAGPRLGRAGSHVRAVRRRIHGRLLGRVAAASAACTARQQTGTATAPGGNMEGKEVRNGIAESALFATVTTDASCGAVNGMHD